MFVFVCVVHNLTYFTVPGMLNRTERNCTLSVQCVHSLQGKQDEARQLLVNFSLLEIYSRYIKFKHL